MNQPQTIAYVIRVRQLTPPVELWPGFEVDKYGKYSRVADDDIRKTIDAYREELATEAGLVWERQPDR